MGAYGFSMFSMIVTFSASSECGELIEVARKLNRGLADDASSLSLSLPLPFRFLLPVTPLFLPPKMRFNTADLSEETMSMIIASNGRAVGANCRSSARKSRRDDDRLNK